MASASTSSATSASPSSSKYLAPTSFLGPNWRHISSFDSLSADEQAEYESEEEVEYATFDLGVVPMGAPAFEHEQYRLIGLDTPTPYLQLGNTIYQGAHSRLIGSEIILRDQKDPTSKAGAKHVLPLHITASRVRFRQAAIRPKPSMTARPSTKPALSPYAAVLPRHGEGTATAEADGEGLGERLLLGPKGADAATSLGWRPQTDPSSGDTAVSSEAGQHEELPTSNGASQLSFPYPRQTGVHIPHATGEVFFPLPPSHDRARGYGRGGRGGRSGRGRRGGSSSQIRAEGEGGRTTRERMKARAELNNAAEDEEEGGEGIPIAGPSGSGKGGAGDQLFLGEAEDSAAGERQWPDPRLTETAFVPASAPLIAAPPGSTARGRGRGRLGRPPGRGRGRGNGRGAGAGQAVSFVEQLGLTGLVGDAGERKKKGKPRKVRLEDVQQPRGGGVVPEREEGDREQEEAGRDVLMRDAEVDLPNSGEAAEQEQGNVSRALEAAGLVRMDDSDLTELEDDD